MFVEIDATEEGFEQGTGDVDSSALDAPRLHDHEATSAIATDCEEKYTL